MKIGVLALQGDVREHARAIEGAGATAIPVKSADEIDTVDALVLPGGESTTIGRLLDRFGLLERLRARVASGMPLYGTCAGMILMAKEITGPHSAEHRIEALDITVRRNAYGRQVDSFEADVEVAGLCDPFRAVFIRAPVVERVGPDVKVVATHDGSPVVVREGALLASSFHPEMTADGRLHELFVDMAKRA